jgi:hypothetical protein
MKDKFTTMYQYVIAFFSTAILTAVITKRYYAKKETPIGASATPFTNPSNIPILSVDWHNNYMRLKTRWESNKINPSQERKNDNIQ